MLFEDMRTGFPNGLRDNDTGTVVGARRIGATTNSVVQSNAAYFRIQANSLDKRLLPNSVGTRVFDVDVSNTANGGNGACSGGTPSTITLYAITLTSKRTTSVVVKK